MIALGNDHGGFELKNQITKYLEQSDIEYKDFGAYSADAVDYPDIAQKVCGAITSGECELGILICGTGIGFSIVANKFRGIRAAACSDHFSAKYTRLHNNANVLCLGGRVIGPGTALELVDVFLNTEFMGGRHAKRLEKVSKIEQNLGGANDE